MARPPMISPGTTVNPADTISRARHPRFPRSEITSGARQVFRPMGATFQGTHAGSLTKANIYVRGLNAVIMDLEAVGAVWQQLSYQVTDFAGFVTAYNAKQLVPWLTGDTYHSISHTTYNGPLGITSDAGPTTFYSPWVEYGAAGRAPNPFMGTAFDMNKGEYIIAMHEVAMVAANLRALGPPYDKVARPVIDNFRTYLYNKQKMLGDISAFGFRPLLSGPRALMLGAARGMGDIQSITGGWAGKRITDRLSGKVTGRIIGMGRVSLQHSASYSGFIGGSVGHRIYQRTAGKYAKMSVGLP